MYKFLLEVTINHMQNKNGTAPERSNRMHLTPRNRIKWRFHLPYSTENQVDIKMGNFGVIGRERITTLLTLVKLVVI